MTTTAILKFQMVKLLMIGSKTILIGMAFPGLKESLGLQGDKIDIPDTVEITMESNDFELGNIMTFITPKVVEDTDLNLFDDLDKIYSKVNTLQTSGNQLEQGANDLKNGTATYLEKSYEFNNAMKEVSSGMKIAYESYSKIDDGISTLNEKTKPLTDGAKKVSDGAKDISNALEEVDSGAYLLSEGTKTLSDNLNAINTKVKNVIEDQDLMTTELTDLITKTNAGIQQLTQVKNGYDQKIKSLNDELQKLQTSTSSLENIEGNSDTSLITTTDNNANNKQTEAIKSEIALYTKLSNEIDAKIRSLKSDLKLYKDLSTSLQKCLVECEKEFQSTPGIFQDLSDSVNKLAKGSTEISDNTKKLKAGVSKLSSGADTLSDGAKSLYDGTEALSDGIQTLYEGSKEMNKGLNTLNDGSAKLLDANNQLTAGASTLSDGANTLANGMSKFNKEGVQSICNLVNGDLKDISLRLEKLQELAEEYNNFTALNKEATRKC